MIEKLETETDARNDARDLWRVKNIITESQFIELAYSMMMQRFHIGVCAALDEARVVLSKTQRDVINIVKET